MVDLRGRVYWPDRNALVRSLTIRFVPHNAVSRIILLVVLLGVPAETCAGPPFITDDPEPVDYRHWEIYVASLFFKQSDAWTGTGPHLEVNYGPLPNLQLHVIAPLAFHVPERGMSSYGYGDTDSVSSSASCRKATGYRRSELFRYWRSLPDPITVISGAGTCKASFLYGFKRAKASGRHMEVVVTGSIRALTIATGGSPGWCSSAGSCQTSLRVLRSFTELRNKPGNQRKPGLTSG